MARWLAAAGLVAANVIWGSSFVVAKGALWELSPTALASLRVVLAAVLFWTLWLAVGRFAPGLSQLRSSGPIPTGAALRMAALGLLGIALSYLLSYRGISLTTATDASMMVIGEVIFTALLAALVASERLGLGQGIGVGLGAIGVGVLVLGNANAGDDPGGSDRALGDLLVLAGVAMQAVYSVAGAGLARRHGVLTLLSFAHAGSLLIWLPLLAVELFTGAPGALSLVTALGVLYLAVAVSVGAFLLWFVVLRVVGAGAAAASLFLQPLVGTALGMLLLQESLSARVLVGGSLVVAAFVLSSGALARGTAASN